jgi:hypothetical protein
MIARLLGAACLCGIALPSVAQEVAQLSQRPSLAFELGPRTRLLLQPPQRNALTPAEAGSPLQRASESGVGLELKLRPARRTPQQLLRLQLSQRSALQFRPRSGGLAISYREQF